MRIFDVEQGSPAWHAVRLGVPTASRFSDIITPSGKKSGSQHRYIGELIAERITGEPEFQNPTFYQQRGSESEAEAVAYYTFQTGKETEKVGFVLSDDGTHGASPDRFVADGDGILEIKVPSRGQHCLYLLETGDVYADHRIQCLGQLMVTGRKYADLLSYSPGIPEALVRIEREEEYIALMYGMVMKFSAELERMWADLVRRGLGDAMWRKEI